MKTFKEIRTELKAEFETAPDQNWTEDDYLRRLIAAAFAEIRPKEATIVPEMPPILKAIQAGKNGCLSELDQNLAKFLGEENLQTKSEADKEAAQKAWADGDRD